MMANQSGNSNIIPSLKKYWLNVLGILVGLALPIGATLVEMSTKGIPSSMRGFLLAQAQNRLLWMIDLAAV
ncbi:hypothetical protein EG832_22660, partial [bacterium]|nr:hypothetical protein [bacterium]